MTDPFRSGRRATPARRCRGRPLSILLVLSLLTLPISYRAGAEIAHSHALLQVLLDASQASVAHHVAGASETGHYDQSASAVALRSLAGGVPLLHRLSHGYERGSSLVVAPALTGTRLVVVAQRGLARGVALLGRAVRPPVPPPRRSRSW